MKMRLCFAWICMLTTQGALSAQVLAVPARSPVLLELFTSEGCSSCPPADRLLAALDEKQPVSNAELIVLSEHVDYWDGLGWKDPFAAPAFTKRQEAYGNRFAADGVYTPQLIVDGEYSAVGSDEAAVRTAIQKAARVPKVGLALSNITKSNGQVTARLAWVGTSPANSRSRDLLYVAVADNRADSHVARGENAGRSLQHVAVTRSLTALGPIDVNGSPAKDIRVPLPSGGGSFRLIAFLQDPKTGRIAGVASERF